MLDNLKFFSFRGWGGGGGGGGRVCRGLIGKWKEKEKDKEKDKEKEEEEKEEEEEEEEEVIFSQNHNFFNHQSQF